MAFLVIYVLDSVGQLAEVLDAWERAGVPGITVLESTGVDRLRRAGLRDDLPLLPSLTDLLADENVYHKTLFSVIEDEAIIDRLVEATQNIVGDFANHHTGLLCVLPLLRVYGLDKPPRPQSGKSDEKALLWRALVWDRQGVMFGISPEVPVSRCEVNFGPLQPVLPRIRIEGRRHVAHEKDGFATLLPQFAVL